MTKFYEVSHADFDITVKVAIDDIEISGNGQLATTADVIKAMVEFWTDWEFLLEMCDGDYTQAFLKQLANETLRIVCEHNCSVKGVIDQFKNREGWAPMNGTFGIEIMEVDYSEPDDTEFTVKEVKK